MARRPYPTFALTPELEEQFDIDREMEQYAQDCATMVIDEDPTDLVDWINNCTM